MILEELKTREAKYLAAAQAAILLGKYHQAIRHLQRVIAIQEKIQKEGHE